MKIVNIHEAKTHLSKLLLRVMSGEEIIVADQNCTCTASLCTATNSQRSI